MLHLCVTSNVKAATIQLFFQLNFTISYFSPILCESKNNGAERDVIFGERNSIQLTQYGYITGLLMLLTFWIEFTYKYYSGNFFILTECNLKFLWYNWNHKFDGLLYCPSLFYCVVCSMIT